MEVKDNELFRNKQVDKQYRLGQLKAYLENTQRTVSNKHNW